MRGTTIITGRSPMLPIDAPTPGMTREEVLAKLAGHTKAMAGPVGRARRR